MLVVCFSKTEEQQCWKCVILKQRSSSVGSVLFKYRGGASLVVCFSNTEEQQCLKCVNLIQRTSSAGSLLF